GMTIVGSSTATGSPCTTTSRSSSGSSSASSSSGSCSATGSTWTGSTGRVGGPSRGAERSTRSGRSGRSSARSSSSEPAPFGSQSAPSRQKPLVPLASTYRNSKKSTVENLSTLIFLRNDSRSRSATKTTRGGHSGRLEAGTSFCSDSG